MNEIGYEVHKVAKLIQINKQINKYIYILQPAIGNTYKQCLSLDYVILSGTDTNLPQ